MRTDPGIAASVALSRLVTVPARLSVWAIRQYQRFLSPWFRGCCRFHPSCSQYAVEAVFRFGFIKGWGLALWRLACCNPFVPGGNDPVPAGPLPWNDPQGSVSGGPVPPPEATIDSPLARRPQ